MKIKNKNTRQLLKKSLDLLKKNPKSRYLKYIQFHLDLRRKEYPVRYNNLLLELFKK